MRYTLVTIGSTGDVRPYVLLGRELKRRGHDVCVCAFSDFEKMVTDEGLRFAPIAGDVTLLMNNIMKPGVTGVTYLYQLQAALKSVCAPFLHCIQNACADADAIVCTFFGSIVYSIAEKNRVPCIQSQYFVMDANSAMPISSAPGLRVGKGWNKMSYNLGYLLINSLERVYVTRWRKEQGMRLRKVKSKPDYLVNGHHIPVLYAMSPLLFPRPLAWDEHIHMTGFWLDETPPPYTPDPALERFLAEGPAPVYVGFGSMVSGDMGKTLGIVLEALREAGLRAVISKGWAGVDFVPPKGVFTAGYVPHTWLFPRMAAVVHHGGAGTTAAGVMAGKPTLVIPFGGDQPFWGFRVRALGLGPKPIRRESLTAEKLAAALADLTTTPSYRVAAQELGARMREEHGVDTAVNIIEREVADWLAEDARATPSACGSPETGKRGGMPA